MKTPQVTAVKVEEVKHNLSKFAQYEKELRELLPTKKRETIEFVLKNVTSRIANALRRTLTEEMLVKVLHTDIEHIDKDEEFLIMDEFIGRLNAIPIDQTVSENATFSLDFVNTDVSKRISYIYSGDITGLGDKADKRFRIAELHPGKHLRVNKIWIDSGYGYQHAKYHLAHVATYRPLDFVDVDMVNERGFIVKGMAALSDVLPRAKKKKSSLNERAIHDERIVFIPDAKWKDRMSAGVRERLEAYTLQLAGSVEFHSSTTSHPKTYYMKVETLGTMPAKALLKAACANIRERLQAVHDGLVPYLKDPEAEPTNVNVVATVEDGKADVFLDGETHTIGELLVMNVWLLDPMVSNVKKRLVHQLDREIVITVLHAEPVRILMDACKKGIADFTALEKGF